MPTDSADTPTTRAQAQMDLNTVNGWLMANQDWQVIPQPNGQLNWGFPGTPPTFPTPVVATIPDFLSKNAGFSVNLATFITNPFTGVSIPGLPSEWTLVGTVLGFGGPLASGPTAVVLQVAWTGGVVLSNSFNLSGVASAAADTAAPTIPLAPAVSLNASSQPVLSWLASNDPAPPGQLRSGMAGYPITRGASTLITVASANTDFNAVLTGADIGAPSAAGSSTQVGSALTIVSYGQDFYGTADQGQFDGVQITGNFSCACVVQSLAGSANQEFAKCGISARSAIGGTGSNGPGSPNVSLVTCPPSLGGGQLMTARTSQGGTSLTYAANDVVYTTPVWLLLTRVGNVFTGSYSSDGIHFTQLSQQTVTLPATLYVGYFATTHDGSGATAITAQLTQCFISQNPALTYTDTSVSQAGSPQTLNYAVNAKDLAGNPSSAAASLSITIPGTGPPAGGAGIMNTNGVLTDLNGVRKPLYVVCVSGLETMHSSGSRVAGFPAATQAQWAQALSAWGPSKGRNIQAQPTALRFQTISSYWNGDTGTDGPLTDSSAWYTGGKPGLSAATYQAALIQTITRATAAGWVCIICLAIDSITEPNGTVHLGLGQPIAPGPTAVRFWGSVAQAFKNNRLVIFELFNEPILSSVNTDNGAGYGTYNANAGGNPYTANPAGPVSPGPDMFTYLNAQSASTVFGPPPVGTNGQPAGCLMMNNSANSSTLQFICNQMKLAGIMEQVTAITNTGAQNLIIASVPSFAGGIDAWSKLGITDPRGTNQVCAAYHCYGQGHWASIQALQAAGIATIMTEAQGGNFTSGSGFKYSQLYAAGLGYSAGSNGWNNWGASANIMTGGASPLTTPPENQNMAVPNGSN